MLGIEFLKIFKRKYTYIYIFISILTLITAYYTKNIYYVDFDISKEEFFYNYLMKLTSVMNFLFVIVNCILSYRKDYSDRMNKLIKFSKMSKFYNLLIKVLVNYFMASIHYFILLSVALLILYLSGDILIIAREEFKNNLILSLALLLFVTNISLLVVVVFNNSSVAIAISILLLTFITFIRDFIEGQYTIQLVGDIFADTFVKISNFSIIDNSTLIQIGIYSVCIFFISLIAKIIKNN